MATQFDEMTNAELKEACADFGLEVKAKNPAKPNKTEYLDALNEFKAAQDNTHSEKIAEKAELAKTAPVTDGSKRKPQSKSQLTKLDLFKKDRVIVRDMQEGQTKDEMISVSWGNRLIGGQTDWVDLSGEAQYIRRGAIRNLEDASMMVQTPKPKGGVEMKTKKRFVIVPVEPMSDEEMATLKASQAMRNSKLA